jgi:PatG C-terminal
MVAVETCAGVVAPVLMVEQVCIFKEEQLIRWCEISPKAPRKPKWRGSDGDEDEQPEPDPRGIFNKLIQSADNFGDTDEWRALNYLAIRYEQLYQLYTEMQQRKYRLVSIEVMESRLWEEKRIVDPVFTFRNENGSYEKYFVRVDVSHLFPRLVHPIAEYFDR